MQGVYFWRPPAIYNLDSPLPFCRIKLFTRDRISRMNERFASSRMTSQASIDKSLKRDEIMTPTKKRLLRLPSSPSLKFYAVSAAILYNTDICYSRTFISYWKTYFILWSECFSVFVVRKSPVVRLQRKPVEIVKRSAITFTLHFITCTVLYCIIWSDLYCIVL